MTHPNKTPDPLPHFQSRKSGNILVWTFTRLIRTACILLIPFLVASDHADPYDPFNRERLEAGITDLFVFPTTENGQVASPFHPRKENGEDLLPFQRMDRISLSKPGLKQRRDLTPEQQVEIKDLVVILCVRRALTQKGSLRLEPFTYKIHMDLHSAVSYDDTEEDIEDDRLRIEQGAGYQPSTAMEGNRPTGQEARARYGGTVQRPDGISPDVTIEFRLNNDASLNGQPAFVGNGLKNTNRIKVETGVFDDPFIFPAFFGTNIVGMALRIPITCFRDDQQDWIVWASSHKGSRQIDHVGRSLRTQNPRFELLNTLPPKDHVAAIRKEQERPSLLRDIALRLNFQQTFAYRKWDFVPDVMIYTNRFPVGFPNGRALTDDVAALLAQQGDTLLFELSHHNGGWPRRTANDKPFRAEFPYLGETHPERPPAPPPSLTRASMLKLWAIAVLLVLILVLSHWLFALWYHRKKLRRRYL